MFADCGDQPVCPGVNTRVRCSNNVHYHTHVCKSLQIVTIKQFALMIVHGFPYIPSTSKLLKAVAEVHEDLALQLGPAIRASGSIVSGLNRLDQYLKAFTAESQLVYVPFFQQGKKTSAGTY